MAVELACQPSVYAAMTMDEVLLEQIRIASRDLWRGMGARIGIRLLLLALAAGFWTVVLARLLGGGGGTDLLLTTVTGAGIALLPAGLALAFLDSLRALIVQGSFLRSLGDLILRHETQPRSPRLEDHFAAFAAPQHLSRLTRYRDLPLIMFLARMVLAQDAKSLMRLAAAGVGREGLIRGLEDRVRSRAAEVIRKLRAALILLLAAILSIPQLAAWLFR
ncbi:MAG TPA: hypothetical protein VLM91_27190 [Candidatus Methylomirabilis sp.]|nr:hypothetical protein [Candidatus Methylomirabilis sp.]